MLRSLFFAFFCSAISNQAWEVGRGCSKGLWWVAFRTLQTFSCHGHRSWFVHAGMIQNCRHLPLRELNFPENRAPPSWFHPWLCTSESPKRNLTCVSFSLGCWGSSLAAKSWRLPRNFRCKDMSFKTLHSCREINNNPESMNLKKQGWRCCLCCCSCCCCCCWCCCCCCCCCCCRRRRRRHRRRYPYGPFCCRRWCSDDGAMVL